MTIIKGLQIAGTLVAGAGILALIITSTAYSISVVVKNIKQ